MPACQRRFEKWSPEQKVMFPSCALDMVRPDHLAHFIRNVVSEQLDLSEILEELWRGARLSTISSGNDDGSVVVCKRCGEIHSSRRIGLACQNAWPLWR